MKDSPQATSSVVLDVRLQPASVRVRRLTAYLEMIAEICQVATRYLNELGLVGVRRGA